MEKEIEVYRALCSLEKFKINGIEASSDDFVEQGDASPSTAEDYSCGDMSATVIAPTSAVLEKYSINVDEYKEVAEEVAKKLSFGACGWCA